MDAVTTPPALSPAWRDDLDVRRAWACLRFANRARARGDHRARVPAIVLTILVTVGVLQNFLAWLVALVRG